MTNKWPTFSPVVTTQLAATKRLFQSVTNVTNNITYLTYTAIRLNKCIRIRLYIRRGPLWKSRPRRQLGHRLFATAKNLAERRILNHGLGEMTGRMRSRHGAWPLLFERTSLESWRGPEISTPSAMLVYLGGIGSQAAERRSAGRKSGLQGKLEGLGLAGIDRKRRRVGLEPQRASDALPDVLFSWVPK